MLGVSKHKTSKGHYTMAMQYKPQRAKLTQSRVKTSQNSGQNMLRLKHKMLEKHAHMLARKQDSRATLKKKQ